MVAGRNPAKNFMLDQDDEDGYASAQSDSVDQLLNGNWKPNFDVDLEDEDSMDASALVPTVLMPTVLHGEVAKPVAVTIPVEEAQPVASQFKYTEADVAAMKAQWKLESEKERDSLQLKCSELTATVTELQQKEGEYLALVAEYETTVTALEAEKSARDATNMEVYARQLSELEVSNTRLRAERAEMETSFQQLHKRYEQLKLLQSNAIKNEGVLKQALAKSQADLMSGEARFLRLKTHAQTQLDAANAEINRIRDESMKKNLLLAAKLSLSQTQVASLAGEYELSRAENETLQSVVSELCTKIQPSSSSSSSSYSSSSRASHQTVLTM